MFERYTEKARRVIFFARYEASQYGASQIEAEHILLGMLREDRSIAARFFPEGHANSSLMRSQIEGRLVVRSHSYSSNVDLPLSAEAKRVLVYAAKESEMLGHRHIETDHLLLGLLVEEGSIAHDLLTELGVVLDDVRNEIKEISDNLRRISDALEKNVPNTIETRPELLAHHLAEAGLIPRAVDYLRKAGQRAIKHSANTEAIGHLNNALALLRSLPADAAPAPIALELEIMLGQAMIASRGYAAPETKKTLLQAKMLIDDRTDPAKTFSVLYGIWAGHYVGGEAAKQRRAAIEFLAEAERHNDTAARCMAHRVLGSTCLVGGSSMLDCGTLSKRVIYSITSSILAFVSSTARTSVRLHYAI